MITLSGTRVEPLSRFDGRYTGAPTLTDIALCLGRIPRFGGATRRWWSVLHHSLVCHRIAALLSEATPYFLLYALLHDAHEAVTGDIPAFWKTPDMSRLQDELDERIGKQLGFRKPTDVERRLVKSLDTVALRAEAWVVGPPVATRYIARGMRGHEGIVLDVLEEFPTFAHTDGMDSPAAKKFYTIFSDLIGVVSPEADHTP